MVDQCYGYCFVFVYVEGQVVVVGEVWWFFLWGDEVINYFVFGQQQFVNIDVKVQFFWDDFYLYVVVVDFVGKWMVVVIVVLG